MEALPIAEYGKKDGLTFALMDGKKQRFFVHLNRMKAFMEGHAGTSEVDVGAEVYADLVKKINASASANAAEVEIAKIKADLRREQEEKAKLQARLVELERKDGGPAAKKPKLQTSQSSSSDASGRETPAAVKKPVAAEKPAVKPASVEKAVAVVKPVGAKRPVPESESEDSSSSSSEDEAKDAVEKKVEKPVEKPVAARRISGAGGKKVPKTPELVPTSDESSEDKGDAGANVEKPGGTLDTTKTSKQKESEGSGDKVEELASMLDPDRAATMSKNQQKKLRRSAGIQAAREISDEKLKQMGRVVGSCERGPRGGLSADVRRSLKADANKAERQALKNK